MYFADFKIDSGGWRNGSLPAEYFLVENRRKAGFDANLPGQGMLVWHAENSTAYSALGNSGGTSNTQARGLVLEEADGDYDLLAPSYLGGNTGDGGDPYPGTSNNREFGSATIPASRTNGGVPSPVLITGVAYGSSNISATFSGGMPAPSIEAVLPDTIDKERDAEAVLDIRGSWMEYGAGAFLTLGFDTVRAVSVDWRGEERIIATFPISSLYSGTWNLVVASGSGQPSTTQKTIEVVSVYLSAAVTAGCDYLLAEWELKDIPGIRGSLLYRFAGGGTLGERVTPDTLRSATGDFSFKDTSVEPGTSYSYLIVTYLNGGREEGYLLPGPYRYRMVQELSQPLPAGDHREFLHAPGGLRHDRRVRRFGEGRRAPRQRRLRARNPYGAVGACRAGHGRGNLLLRASLGERGEEDQAGLRSVMLPEIRRCT